MMTAGPTTLKNWWNEKKKERFVEGNEGGEIIEYEKRKINVEHFLVYVMPG